MSSIEPYTDCCNVTTYYAEATSTAKAFTATGELVTSTSSATATSHVSYDDALESAQKIADEVAQSNADHDANVIDEAVTISNGNNDDVLVLENLSANDNNYEIQDNTDRIYIKGSVGNATNLPDQIFPLGNVTNLALNAGIYSLEKDNSGNIYAGGSFAYTNSTYIQLNGIGKWDGSVWNSLDNGFFYSDSSGTSVRSVKMDNKGNLYAGGLFNNAYDKSGTSLKNIAVWNGTKWNALGNNTNTNNGTNGLVNCLAVDSSDNVYVGGSFTQVTQTDGTTLTVNNIAKWNGSIWSALGRGTVNTSATINGIVTSLSIDRSNNVYVGGIFTSVTNSDSSTITANYIAKWNGSTWSYLGSNSTTSNGVSGIVYSSIFDSSNNLIIGGSFQYANYNSGAISGTTVNGIAKLIGTTWVTVGSNQGFLTYGGNTSTIYALEFDSSQNLVAGGNFQKLGDNSKLIYNIAKYNGTNWNSVGGGNSGILRSLLLSDSNEIIIGSTSNILPYNTYFNSNSYISKISNSYVNLYYNNVRLITQYYEGQSTSIKTVKNNSSNKKVGYVYPNSYNVTETYV